MIGLWGPRAPDVLPVEGLAFSHAREIDVGGASVLVQRVSYVGEPGYELYVAPEWAVQVWDRLMTDGEPHGIRPGGYRVLESLRIEKGFRYFGTDLTASDTPEEGGVGFCVAPEKQLAAAPRHRLRSLLVGGEDYLCLYGGEAVRIDGSVVGRVRSAAYGFTVRGNLALATLPPDVEESAAITVDVLGEPVRAALYDS